MELVFRTAEEPRFHRLEAWDSGTGRRVGWLTWWRVTREVDMICVDVDYRRQGIATRLWLEALASDLPRPVHSRRRTGDGKAWVKTLNERYDRTGKRRSQ